VISRCQGRAQLNIALVPGAIIMISYLFSRALEASPFQISESAWFAPLSTLNWRIVIPAALFGNIVMSVLAWLIVELVLRLV
jgi:hypothetical protein